MRTQALTRTFGYVESSLMSLNWQNYVYNNVFCSADISNILSEDQASLGSLLKDSGIG